MSRSLYAEFYRESTGAKAFLLALGSGVVVYCISAVAGYFEITHDRPTAANPHPALMTSFPPSFAFFGALYPAVGTALVVFIVAVLIFSVVAFCRRRHEDDI